MTRKGEQISISDRKTMFNAIMRLCGEAEFADGTIVYPIKVGDRTVTDTFGNGKSVSESEPLIAKLHIEIDPDTFYFRPALDTVYL